MCSELDLIQKSLSQVLIKYALTQSLLWSPLKAVD